MEFAATICFLCGIILLVLHIREKWNDHFEGDGTEMRFKPMAPRRKRGGVFNENGEFLGWINKDGG